MTAASLLEVVELTKLKTDEISARVQQIRSVMLEQSQSLDGPNFRRICPGDLQLLFDEYDQRFFAGQIQQTLGDMPLTFCLSKRMTSAGGTTKVSWDNSAPTRRRFEITVATSILFQCFTDEDHRPITVSGIVCRDRLDSLQRVMEHEITHLVEMLLWEKSSCAKKRFQSITRRMFGHTDHKHQMITPRERAKAKFGITPGMMVRFRLDGVNRVGLVNRVTKRATVLVEDSSGQRYRNGKRYAKFYIPVEMLRAISQSES